MVLVKFVSDVKNGLAIYLKQLAIFLEPKKRLRNKTSQNSNAMAVVSVNK